MFSTRFAGESRLGLYAILGSLMMTAALHAATIGGLFNTGVDSFGNALVGAGVADPHYSYQLTQSNPFPVTVQDTSPFPILGGPWVPNNAFSRWIGPDGSSQGPGGNYIYRTTFNVPANANLSTVNVSGLWGTDDPSIDIYINGNSTGSVSAGFTTLVPFNVASGFVFGLNTLDFALTNAGGPTGLRVDRIVGTYKVPEPASVCLAGAALVASLGMLRRIRAGRQMS